MYYGTETGKKNKKRVQAKCYRDAAAYVKCTDKCGAETGGLVSSHLLSYLK